MTNKKYSIGNILKTEINRINNSNKNISINTGIKALDHVLGGLKPGQLILIGGRPAIGKTSLALNIAINIARSQDTNVLYFSLADDAEDLAKRILMVDSNIDHHLLRKKLLNNKDRKRLSKGLKALAPLPLYINDKAFLSTRQIIDYMNEAARQGELDLVVIDYLSLLTDMTNASKIKDNMIRLKYYAEKLSVPIIITAQLSRKVDLRQFPQDFNLSDFRGSKAIGDNADTAIFIYRKEYYKGPSGKKYEEMQLMINKKAGRKKSVVPLLFDRNTSKIADFDHS